MGVGRRIAVDGAAVNAVEVSEGDTYWVEMRRMAAGRCCLTQWLLFDDAVSFMVPVGRWLVKSMQRSTPQRCRTVFPAIQRHKL